MEASQKLIKKAVEEETSTRTMLNISLLRAQGLQPVQKGTAVSCCGCQLEGRPYTQLRTEAVTNAADPVWNYTGMIDGCVNGDSIEFMVFNSSTGAPESCLGRAVLLHDQFHPHGFSGEIALVTPRGARAIRIEVRVEVLPVPVTAPRESRMFVFLAGAENLRAAGQGSLSGSQAGAYCVCEIPGKPDSKVRSKICSPVQSPWWNELHELEDYSHGDQLQFTIYAQGDDQREEELGVVVLKSRGFQDTGFAGKVHLARNGDAGAIMVCIAVGGPSRSPNRELAPQDYDRGTVKVPRIERLGDALGPMDDKSLPGRVGKRFEPTLIHAKMPVGLEPPSDGTLDPDDGERDRQLVPFQLRSLSTTRVHRLCAYTLIGRSKTHLDPNFDLILDSPGISDVSRVHALITVQPGLDTSTWHAQILDEKTGRGHYYDAEGCRQLVGGGTSVDGQPVDPENGTEIVPGSVLRFGVNEFWVMESAPLHQRLRIAEIACRQAAKAEDPDSIREMKVPNFNCDATLHRCGDWISIVRVVLEACNQPDEAPCADVIEVKDECGRPVSRHLAMTLEQQEAYDVKKILQDVRLGTTVRLRLSSDPLLLAPVLGHLAQINSNLEELYRSRADILS